MKKNEILMAAWVAKAAHDGEETETNFHFEPGMTIIREFNLPTCFHFSTRNGYLTIHFSTRNGIPVEFWGIDGISGAFSER